jgi:KUP system potassium uptake protein
LRQLRRGSALPCFETTTRRKPSTMLRFQALAVLEVVTESIPSTSNTGQKKLSGGLAIAALGVVFGDIGTSPLYTLQVCFSTAHASATAENVTGIVSALIWTLVLVVCIKYVTLVMKVDHDGEGGILALLARLIAPDRNGVFPRLGFLTVVGIVGAAALLGDGIITPAISVLSAVEGMGEITPNAASLEVPITIAVLLGLFVAQMRGTQSIGVVFGPVMGLWFAAIGVSGAHAIFAKPEILAAADPRHAAWFITHHGIFGFLLFGATILCVTGAEALYADMSHFGRRAITVTWYGIVFPALLLNYLGQGAVLLQSPQHASNPFYALTSGWMLIPMVFLATAATVIASQALIAGAFTIVQQAIALELSPRMRVIHTNNRYPGQVFVPAVNVLLAIGSVSLVLVFRSSASLAAAYGLAVALTMAATSVLFYAVVRRVLHWTTWGAGGALAFMMLLDGSFVLAGLVKIPAGGWIPLAIALSATVVSTIWYSGRRRVLTRLASDAMPVTEFVAQLERSDLPVIDGTLVFFTNNTSEVPYILHHTWARIQSLHERIVLLTLERAAEPYVDDAKRVTVSRISSRLTRVEACFGFMELPSLQPVINGCGSKGLHIEGDGTSYVVALARIVPGATGWFSACRRWLFATMTKLVGPLPESFKISPDQLVELGIGVRF